MGLSPQMRLAVLIFDGSPPSRGSRMWDLGKLKIQIEALLTSPGFAGRKPFEPASHSKKFNKKRRFGIIVQNQHIKCWKCPHLVYANMYFFSNF